MLTEEETEMETERTPTCCGGPKPKLPTGKHANTKGPRPLPVQDSRRQEVTETHRNRKWRVHNQSAKQDGADWR